MASEVALARLGLAALEGVNLEVIVGGLGLGYTAQAVLEHEAAGSLIVVEMLDAVIDRHQTGLLPLGPSLVADKRCRLVQGDFFAMSRSEAGFDPDVSKRRFDAVLVDIDHSPDALLDDRSISFYQPSGLLALTAHIKPGGIFGLWSNDKPDRAFVDRLSGILDEAWAEVVTFHNPLRDRPFTQTVYLGRTAATSKLSPVMEKGVMPTTAELNCPKCQGQMATVFTGKRPRRRLYVCSKCDSLPDPMTTAECQGWIASDLKPPEKRARLSGRPNPLNLSATGQTYSYPKLQNHLFGGLQTQPFVI